MDDLIKEYVHLTYLVEYAKKDIENMHSAIPIKIAKVIGGHFRDRLKYVSTELRKNSIYVRIEDGENVLVHVSNRGQKTTQQINRLILQRELQVRLEKMAEDMEKINVDIPYKVEFKAKDPYAKE